MNQRNRSLKRKTSRKKIFFGFFIVFILAVVITVGGVVMKIGSPAFDTDKINYLYIDENKNYETVLKQLESQFHIKDIRIFEQLASFMKYPQNLKAGKYEIEPKLNYVELIRMLRNGNQIPVKLAFNNVRLKKDFAEKVGNQLMFGPERLESALSDPEICRSFGLYMVTIEYVSSQYV